ncbi:MAG: hypothetical protein WCL08_00015 [Verrucomicrobiota bacterium]
MKTILALLLISSAAYAALPTEVSTLSKAKTAISSLKTELVATQAELSESTTKLSEASSQLDATQAKADSLQLAIDKLAKSEEMGWTVAAERQTKIDKAEDKQLQTGRERDVFLVAFAIAGAALAYSFLRPILMVAVPPPYNFLATPAAALASFVGCFYAGRLIVAQIVHMIF